MYLNVPISKIDIPRHVARYISIFAMFGFYKRTIIIKYYNNSPKYVRKFMTQRKKEKKF